MLIVGLGVGLAPASQATLLPPKRTEVVAKGPGFVMVGSGARLAPDAIPASYGKFTCGWTSCSLYFTRKATKNLHTNTTAATAVYGSAGLFCALPAIASGPGAAFVGASCGAFWAAQGGFIFNAVNRAEKKKGCLQIKLHFPVGPYTFHAVKKSNPYCLKK